MRFLLSINDFLIMRVFLSFFLLSLIGLCSFSSAGQESDLRKGEVFLNLEQALESQFSQETTTYVIEDVLDLNGRTVAVPYGCSLRFLPSGDLTNGTLILDDTELIDAHGLSCNLKGTVSNESIYSSWFCSLDNIELDFNEKTFYFDTDTQVSKGLHFSNVHHAVFDGQGHTIENPSCTFLSIGENCTDIEVRNFICTGDGEGAFFAGSSSRGEKKNIIIHDNKISHQRLGISLNADLDGKYSNCAIYGNTIRDISGENPGHGYGIHLANIEHCVIRDNIIENCDRHSIYHAWGNHNTISGNTIRNHRANVPFNLRAAVAIYRNSHHVRIENNLFENGCSMDIHLNASPDGSTARSEERDGNQYGIMIARNRFIHNKQLPSAECMGIMVGYNVLSYEDTRYYVEEVRISDNYFEYCNTNASTAIRSYLCKNLTVKGNTFVFDSATNGNLVFLSAKYSEGAESKWAIVRNSFVARGIFGASKNAIYLDPAFKQGLGKYKLRIQNNALENSKVSASQYNYRALSLYGVEGVRQRD